MLIIFIYIHVRTKKVTFFNIVVTHFYNFFSGAVILLIISVIFGLNYLVNRENKLSFEIFSVSTGVAAILGLLLALAEIRTRLRKITAWKNLVKEITSLVEQAKDFVVMLTYYPTIGMISLKKSIDSNEYNRIFDRFTDTLEKRSKEIRIMGLLACEELRNNEIEEIAIEIDHNRRDIPDLQRKCKNIIIKLNLNYQEKWNENEEAFSFFETKLGYHLIFSERQGIIFTPLNISKDRRNNNKRNNNKRNDVVKIEFIGNVTFDSDVIFQFMDTMLFFKQSDKVELKFEKFPFE